MTLLPVLLPEGYEPKVSVNDKLTAGAIIAQKTANNSEEVLHVSRILGINPQQIAKFLRKHLGDSVSEGDLLASKKVNLGLTSKKILSKFSGTIIKIDEESGDIYIRTVNKGLTGSITSPIDGTVDFCNNEKIVIKTDKQAVMAEDAVGKEKTGELMLISNFDSSKLTTDVQDKILLVRDIDRTSIFKAIGLDAAGVITENLKDADFVDLSEKQIPAAVMIVSADNFNKLEKFKGKKVFLDTLDKGIVIL